ncbi:MAG: ABC transporter permease [Mycolicibacterium sp.]|uniref:ABC transporter permease n=1 Tax=Mycolicibacterium sp. TaxID=2320850 RepID=UPI003D12B0C4
MIRFARVAAAIDAERIKLTTVRSPWWAALGAAALSLGTAALQTVPGPALGIAVFGVPVLMVVAATTVTGEYRTAMARTTFLAVPDRTLVLCAKAVVAALFSSIFAALIVLGAIVVARLDIDAGGWRSTGAVAIYAALAAVLGVGAAALLRHTAGAVTVLLLWPLLVEPLLGNLPRTAGQIGPYLPFANVLRFLDVQWLFPNFTAPWGPLGSLGYFALVVAVVFVAAVLVVNLRDA